MIWDGHSLDSAVNKFLIDYRNTEHMTMGKTPSFLMYNRNLRTRYDLPLPDIQADIEYKQFKSIENYQG